jgi:hypothetical protein
MLHIAVHRGLCILLSVAIIATNGIVPGAVHSHAGGDKPHVHAANEIAHTHGHHHHSHASHDHASKHQHPHKPSVGIENGVAHSHVDFFGVPLTVPEKSDGDTKSRRLDIVRPVEIAAEENAAISQSVSAPRLASDTSLCFGAEIVAGTELASYHPPHENQSLLCDTARLKRSGVLQI